MIENNNQNDQDQIRIDPWGFSEIKDHYKLFTDFGLGKVTNDHAAIFRHHLFRRGLVIAQRDLESIINAIKSKRTFYCLTGIACSGPLHFGHKLIFDIVMAFKQQGAKTKFVVADLDGYLARPRISSLEQAQDYAIENLAHALALGIDRKDIYLQSQMPDRYYSFSYEVSKKITQAEFNAIYGTIELGKISAVMLQIADILHMQLSEFGKPMPCVVPVGIDQDPHIRITRDVCKRTPYGIKEPAGLYIAHQPDLAEGTNKMSSSVPQHALFLADKAEIIRQKIQKAFSGGAPTLQEHRERGGNPDICKVCALLKFHHPDDKFVNRTITEFRAGTMTAGELKQLTIDFFVKWSVNHQKKLIKTKRLAEKIVKG